MKRNNQFLRTFGRIVAAKRRELGISQEELAHRAKINRTYIGDIERGARNMAALNIVKLCVALQTTPSSLFAKVEKVLGPKIQP